MTQELGKTKSKKCDVMLILNALKSYFIICLVNNLIYIVEY